MQTVHLPGDEPTPDTAINPKRVPLARLAGRSGGSPALTRAVAVGVERRGPLRVAVAAFQSSV